MKLMVPDLAIVPKFYIRSFLVIPTPVSIIDTVLASLSNSTLISRSFKSPRISGF